MSIVRKAALLGAAAMLAASQAHAADYPRKPVELVVPFAQGGGTDQVGRLFAQHVGEYLGGEVFVSNRTGGSGAVGFSHGARARPDGHVLTMAATTISVAPHTVANYPLTSEDFTPICLLTALPLTLAVQADGPYKSVEDLVAAAKANPGKIKIGSAGAGTNNYLAGVAVAKDAGIDITMVPYDGANPSLVALVGGHVDATTANTSEVLQYAESGQARVVLVLGDEKAAEYPDAPTAASKGWEANVASYRGIMGPKDMPADVTEKLIDSCEKMAKDQGFIDDMAKFGMSVNLISGDAFGDWLVKQNETYAAAAKAAGIEPK